MLITGAKVWVNHAFQQTDIFIENKKIARLGQGMAADGEVLDAAGCYAAPGLIDMHIHGAVGCDFSDADADGVKKIADYLAKRGVTGFLGTGMALPEQQLTDAFSVAKELAGQDAGGAILWGINMEGPFFSEKKKGAQAKDYLRKPDFELFCRLNEACGKNIKLADVAPELPGAKEFIRNASKICRVSLAHTAADYETAHRAFEVGAADVTHLFNAMTPFDHRAPGVLAAAAESAEFVELISDGVHLHPATVRLAFRLFGADRICLISDAMRGCGMAQGVYTLGGQEVTIRGGHATLADGTLAGSVTDLARCVQLAVGFGIPLESALQAASENPAKALGIFDKTGSIAVGKRADLVLLDEKDLSVRGTVIGGRRIM